MASEEQTRLFRRLVGEWKGNCKTWFKPDVLADDSEVAGKIESVLGNFLRHTYHGEIESKPRKGEELIGYDAIIEQFQVAWIDDFHMSKAILISDGIAIEDGFSVVGKYEVGPGQPAWKWRTNFQLVDEKTLNITAFNITPDGQEAKAVETNYKRAG